MRSTSTPSASCATRCSPPTRDTYKVNGNDYTAGRNARVAGASFAVPWRATLSNIWSLGGHSVQSLLRYTDAYYNDQTPNAGTAVDDHVEHYLTWDIAYSYNFGESGAQVRARSPSALNNVLDESPPYVPDGNHTLSSMYDYSGRHIWLRLKAAF